MRKKSLRKKKEYIKIAPSVIDQLKEGWLIIGATLSIFCLVILLTYNPNDPSWSYISSSVSIKNWGGKLGAMLADILFLSFGYMAFILPVISLFMIYRITAVKYFKNQSLSSAKSINSIKILGLCILIVSGCGLLAKHLQSVKHNLPAMNGGILGDLVARSLINNFNSFGSDLILWASFLIGITLNLEISIIKICIILVRYILRKAKYTAKQAPKKLSSWDANKITMQPKQSIIASKQDNIISSTAHDKEQSQHKKLPTDGIASNQILPSMPKSDKLPDLALLQPPIKTSAKPCLPLPFHEFSKLIEQRLLEFGVAATVSAFYPGPVITRFELALAPGVKVSKITGLAKDIARALSVASVRVVEVIPGKAVIGLEVANQNRETVVLSEILSSSQYTKIVSPVALGLGKDISGVPVVVDLAKMPHLLAAGTTGSGKSVSLNVMLLSMLYKATPAELRFILIDPKMLELSIYDGIPHLLTPVITDMNEATNALRWCVTEMDKRYKLMSYLGVRNLAGYNAKINDGINKGCPVSPPEWWPVNDNGDPLALEPLPLIVVVADELADLIMVVGKKIEELVVRLAQKARAAGMHLILATQRPSVDVITGLIKANVPTRIAFQVSSRIDSRTILDQQGAEQLLGHGDMLYLPAGAGIPTRIHGAYVSDEEVHSVVAAWQGLGKPEYLTNIVETERPEESTAKEINAEQDPLYDQAVFIVTESRRASTSLIQRRLRIGYNRAARLMEYMEAAGLVTAIDSSGNRKVIAAPPPPT